MSRLAFGLVAIVLLVLTLSFFTPVVPSGDMGLCLPSPNQWGLMRFPSWLIDTVLLFLSAFLMGTANKKYNFIPEDDSTIGLALLLLMGCCCIPTAILSTSTLLLFCNALCLFIIISTYEETNATREFFIVATFPAIGSMFQYAFLTMIPIYIGGGLLMKSFRIREFIAFIFGLLAPFWIVLGTGIISPQDFRLPESFVFFNRQAVESDIFFTLLSAGTMALIGFILSLYNGVRLLSRNSRLRCMHLTFNLMGFVAVLAIIFDFRNFTAYTGTLALWVAVETAAVLQFYKVPRPRIALLFLLIVFLPFYILAL